MNKWLKNQQGLTLLELVIVVSLFSVIIIIISQVFTRVMDNQNRILAEQDLQADLKYGLGVLFYEAQEAQIHPDDSCSYSGFDLTGKYFGSDQSVEIDGGVILYMINKKGQCVKYYLDNGVLKRQVGIEENSLTSDKIEISNWLIMIGKRSDSFTVKIKAYKKGQPERQVSYQMSLTRSNYEATAY